MSKKEFVLAARDWILIRNALGGSGAESVADQASKFKLHCRLANALEAADEEADLSIRLTIAQARVLVNILNNPPVPWRISATEYVWRIKKVLGWAPQPDEEMDGGDDDEEVEE